MNVIDKYMMSLRSKKTAMLLSGTVILLVLGFVMTFLIIQKLSVDDSADARQPFVIITARGGNCSQSECVYEKYAIYPDGRYDKHARLSAQQVSSLRAVVDGTDFTAYHTSGSAYCDSFADGSDRVYLFPRKYGDRTFVPCVLDVPKGDIAFAALSAVADLPARN